MSVVEVIILAFAAMCVLAVALAPVLRDAEPEWSSSVTIKVANSQTLWGIAQEHPIPGLSTAQTVSAIRKANGLEQSTLYAGQILRVPTLGDSATAMARR